MMKEFEGVFVKLFKNDEQSATKYIEQFVIENPDDDEAKIACALHIQGSPYDDYPKAQSLLNDILTRDSCNIKAILLKGYMENIHIGQISYQTVSEINRCLDLCSDDLYLKQLFLLKAEYYRYKNKAEYIRALQQSIQVDSLSSYNYLLLGKETNDKELFEKGIKNINIVYSQNDISNFNPIDFDEFINEHLRGTSVTSINYESLKNEFKNM